MYNGNSLDIGNIGEAVAIAEFQKRSIQTFLPFGHNNPIDIIALINNKLIRIQCKTTQKTHNNEYMYFNLTRDTRAYQHLKYTENEIDYFFLYCIENGFKGLISIQEINCSDVTIRLTAPKNNQCNRIRMYYDYDFNYRLNELITRTNIYCPIQFIFPIVHNIL